jgi:putative FmdB family regulatory protein
MPTYQYACMNADCGNQFELVQSFTDPSASECPACEGPVRKVFSAVGVVFKGPGFYRTDSRTGADKSSEKSSEKSSDKPAAKSTSTESTSSSSSSDSTPAPSTSASFSSSGGSTPPAKAAASA